MIHEEDDLFWARGFDFDGDGEIDCSERVYTSAVFKDASKHGSNYKGLFGTDPIPQMPEDVKGRQAAASDEKEERTDPEVKDPEEIYQEYIKQKKRFHSILISDVVLLVLICVSFAVLIGSSIQTGNYKTAAGSIVFGWTLFLGILFLLIWIFCGLTNIIDNYRDLQAKEDACAHCHEQIS